MCYDSIATLFFTDNCFSFMSTLADALHSMDVSRAFWTRLLHIPASCITCHRLVYSYVPVPVLRVSSYEIPIPIWIVDSSPDTCLSSVSPFVLLTRLLTFLAYAFLFSSRRLVSMLTFTAYAFPFVVCRLVSRLAILGL